MHRRPFRACLSVLLVFTLLSMLPPRAAVAVPMMKLEAAQQMHMLHGMGQVADHVSLDRAASDNGQHDQCQCGVHCGLCGVCHSTLSSAMVSSFAGMGVTPAGLRLLSLAEIYLSPDPHPPRA